MGPGEPVASGRGTPRCARASHCAVGPGTWKTFCIKAPLLFYPGVFRGKEEKMRGRDEKWSVVHLGGVEEVDAGVECGVEEAERLRQPALLPHRHRPFNTRPQSQQRTRRERGGGGGGFGGRKNRSKGGRQRGQGQGGRWASTSPSSSSLSSASHCD